MAHRVLKTLAASSALVILAACHDWAAFDDVPTSAPTQSTSGTTPTPEAGAAETAPVVTPDSTVFGQVNEKPTIVAADAQGIVFLTKQGSVLTCPHEGCALPATIAAAQYDARALAIGFGFVAWIARGDQAVRRAPRNPGSGPAVTVKEPNGLLAVALTPELLYFSVDGEKDLIRGEGIRRCTPGLDCHYPSGQFDGFAHGRVTELRLDGADSYWLADDGVHGCPISACSDDGNKAMTLAKEPVLPSALALDAEQMYFGSTLEGGSIRSLPRSVINGGAIPASKPLATKLGAPSRLAVTATDIWFVDPVGIVARISKKTGVATTVATGLGEPTGIALGGGYVYVTCAGDGRILRWRDL